MDEIKEFLELFGLTEGDYSNEKILEHLKKIILIFIKHFVVFLIKIINK